MATDLPNVESHQLAHALERFIPGPDRQAAAREIAACLWNMVCAAVYRHQKPEETR